VTDLRDAYAILQAREAQLTSVARRDAVGKLTTGLAHEFGSALAGVIGLASLLRDALDPGDPRREDADEIMRVAGEAVSLVDRVRQLSDPLAAVREALDLGQVVRAFAEVARRILPTTIEMVVDLPAVPLPVRLDRARFEEALMVLVLNARDAMPVAGTLTLAVSTGEDPQRGGLTACVRVRDTGVGIPPEFVEVLWDPFFTTKPQGTGLSLTRARARRHPSCCSSRTTAPCGSPPAACSNARASASRSRTTARRRGGGCRTPRWWTS
jgi:signal transduction histidine kinase